MGIVWCYYLAKVEVTQRGIVLNTQFHLISLVLNVLLTLMIIIRLALHTRNIRNALGASSGLGGLYTALIIMLVESSALNAVGYLLFIISGSVHSFVWYIFSPILGEIQVRVDFHLFQRTGMLGHRLINEMDRSSLCSSSFYESQTGLR